MNVTHNLNLYIPFCITSRSCNFAAGDEIEVYEEMALYHQSESKKRPIVLIALPNVGRHELRQRLVENDRDRFAFAVPRKL